MTPKERAAIQNYMAVFGQALEAHSIPYTEQQSIADEVLREALGYCIDEGCPHHGTTHTCVNPLEQPNGLDNNPLSVFAKECVLGAYTLEELPTAASLALRRAEQPVNQEPVECEPVPPISEDGWTDWVCPTPKGYLMQCCDCGLIHEVDSRVAKYQPIPSEEFEVVEDPDMQCQWRMRRRDDISPTKE